MPSPAGLFRSTGLPGLTGPSRTCDDAVACNGSNLSGYCRLGTAMMMREEELKHYLVLANAGDETAYRMFFNALLPALRILATAAMSRTSLPAADAEDIVQETLVALHQKRHTFDPAYPVGPWVRGIVRHKLLDALRRRRVVHVPIEDFDDLLPISPSETRDDMAEVIKLAEGLPVRQRDAVLAVVQGFSGRAAAARASMTEGAFRVALHRGISRLARMVEG
ncbi:MAG: RNA polymerase sigma-70 factor ECF [Beijerinckiaceae bacterium]|nr:MAG: RNA polymerase sigma-70 factor ECF [Beijerinckiaceae bacterium]